MHLLFQNVALKLGYKIVESEEGFATAVYKRGCSWKRAISCCFQNYAQEEAENITAIKLAISLDESKCNQRIILKGLYGVNIFTVHRVNKLEP